MARRSPSASGTRPRTSSSGSGRAAIAVVRNTAPITATIPTRTRSTHLYRPLHSRAKATKPRPAAHNRPLPPSNSCSPSEPPSRLPVSYAALPIRIAPITSAAETTRPGPPAKRRRIASPRPIPPTTPTRTAISWSTSAASTEKASAQTRVYAWFAPATVAVVTVPGPIKAAATITPGPSRTSRSLIAYLSVSLA